VLVILAGAVRVLLPWASPSGTTRRRRSCSFRSSGSGHRATASFSTASTTSTASAKPAFERSAWGRSDALGEIVPRCIGPQIAVACHRDRPHEVPPRCREADATIRLHPFSGVRRRFSCGRRTWPPRRSPSASSG